MKQKKHLMVDNYMVDEVLDKIKEIIGIEIVPEAWHPTRWWDWYMPEDEKKEPIFTDKVVKW